MFKLPQKTAVFLFVLLEIHNYFFGATHGTGLGSTVTLLLPFFRHFITLFLGHHVLGIKESSKVTEHAIRLS